MLKYLSVGCTLSILTPAVPTNFTVSSNSLSLALASVAVAVTTAAAAAAAGTIACIKYKGTFASRKILKP
jgi:hypothetical protein